MITLGFSTLTDLLVWVVILSMGIKLVATLILLCVDKSVRFRPGWGSTLWWATKITPILAAPCAWEIARRQHNDAMMALFAAMTLFVIIAVPLKIRQRRSSGGQITPRQPSRAPAASAPIPPPS